MRISLNARTWHKAVESRGNGGIRVILTYAEGTMLLRMQAYRAAFLMAFSLDFNLPSMNSSRELRVSRLDNSFYDLLLRRTAAHMNHKSRGCASDMFLKTYKQSQEVQGEHRLCVAHDLLPDSAAAPNGKQEAN